MRSLLVLLALALNYSVVCACSYDWYHFCSTNSQNQQKALILGEIIDTSDHSITIVVSEVWRGSVNSDTIRIWDNTPDTSQCHFNHKATTIGKQGIKMLTILTPIDSAINSWDVVGEYRMQYSEGWTYTLKIDGDSIHGLINGPYPYYLFTRHDEHVWSMHLSDFRAQVQTNGSCQYLSIDEEEGRQPEIFLQQLANNQFIIKGISVQSQYAVFSVTGNLLSRGSAQAGEIISLREGLTPGIYLIKIESPTSKRSRTFKYVYR